MTKNQNPPARPSCAALAVACAVVLIALSLALAAGCTRPNAAADPSSNSDAWIDTDAGVRPGEDGLVAPESDAVPTPGDDAGVQRTRAFPMGFLPLPHDVTTQAQAYTMKKLASDADLVLIQLYDAGIPWVEALADKPFSSELITSWHYQRSLVPAGHKVLLALRPTNKGKDGLALYFGAQKGQPLPPPWDKHGLAHPDVKQAYLNYCKRAIAFFKPDHVLISSEVDAVVQKNPGTWSEHLALHKATYAGLKQGHPKLPVFASWFATSLLPLWTSGDHVTQRAALKQYMAHSDYLGLSVFPFVSAYGTGGSAGAVWPELIKLSSAQAPGKPIAVVAAGYLARSVWIDSWNLQGTPGDQQQFVVGMLQHARQHGFALVVNTVLRDFDALWSKWGHEPEGAAIKSTGLYAADGAARPALYSWKQALADPLK
jgi:hypothetical protein